MIEGTAVAADGRLSFVLTLHLLVDGGPSPVTALLSLAQRGPSSVATLPLFVDGGASPGAALPLLVEWLSLRYAYVTFAVLFAIGLYMMIASPNLVKKIIGLNMFQSAIFLFFVSTAYVEGARVPVVPTEGATVGEHASPLPQVIVLTAIVVGVSLTAVALALVVRIYAEYGTLREDTIREVTDE